MCCVMSCPEIFLSKDNIFQYSTGCTKKYFLVATFGKHCNDGHILRLFVTIFLRLFVFVFVSKSEISFSYFQLGHSPLYVTFSVCPSVGPSVFHTSYLRNCTSYDHNFWYTCVKWWNLKCFFWFFKKIDFWCC